MRIVTFEHSVEVAEQLVRDPADYCRAHGFKSEEGLRSRFAEAQTAGLR